MISHINATDFNEVHEQKLYYHHTAYHHYL